MMGKKTKIVCTIGPACDNEKTMGTYLGIGEVEHEK